MSSYSYYDIFLDMQQLRFALEEFGELGELPRPFQQLLQCLKEFEEPIEDIALNELEAEAQSDWDEDDD